MYSVERSLLGGLMNTSHDSAFLSLEELPGRAWCIPRSEWRRIFF